MKTGLGSGRLYRGEIVHEFEGGAAVWPTWLGARVDFKDGCEAEGFVDAAESLQIGPMKEHYCPWCLEKGVGILLTVNENLVLSSHEKCRAEAGAETLAKRPQIVCDCCDPAHAGDGCDCPVHGVVADVLFRSCIQVSTVSKS